MTTTKTETRTTTIATTEKITNRWSLAISYWVGQEIKETFSGGQTKSEALKNWFVQYYQGRVPEKPLLPSKRDTIFISWVKFVPAK